jgi:hypothetical protein
VGFHTRSSARVLGAAVAAGLVAVGASQPARAVDVETLRTDAQTVADDVTSLERRLARLNDERALLEADIEDANRAIGTLELVQNETEEAYQEALDDYVASAVALYKAGPTPALDLMLSARSMSDAFTIVEATDAYDESASRELDSLIRVKNEAALTQARIDASKQELLVSKQRADAIAGEIAGTLATRRARLRVLTQRIAALERAARLAAARAAHPGEALLDLLTPSGPAPGIPDGFAGTGVTFEGIASWYGPGFEGNSTANGDIFDPNLYTAASLDLPLGSWLYVAHEGRGVVVYVNDRGPYIEDRILDLSQAAAEAIGITGLGWIQAEVLIKT